jgi:gamma-glutamyltranspeptidase/glutathione hydrolase
MLAELIRLTRKLRSKRIPQMLLVLLLGLTLRLHAQAVPDAVSLRQPEGAGAVAEKSGWQMRRFAVAAANPLAAKAGQRILLQGGSAVDAAVAVQMVLGLVEPQSSGLGGGAFLLHFDGKSVQAFDGREVAPQGVDARLFLDASGQPMPFMDAVVGGRAVGVPGALAMLETAHRQHGKLPWSALFAPAIELAESGFAISPRMATLLAADPFLKIDPVAAAYFYGPDGRAWPEGHVLRNPEYAAVLRDIAKRGAEALLDGETAQAIVRKVQTHPTNPGWLTLQDLRAYRPVVREALCFDHRVAAADRSYRVCGMPPPSSGTIAIGQILGVLNLSPADAMGLSDGVPSAQWLHWYTEASRLAFADRGQYVADPAFVAAPGGDWSRLLAPGYLRQRASLINTGDASGDRGARMPTVAPGKPGPLPVAFAPMPAQEEHGTSHISIIDNLGNALAMTTTIEDAWGSRQMVNRGQGLTGGFLLNNELTDFSFVPTGSDGLPVANRVEPGKRPRSSMSPLLVFDKANGALILSAGSPGGALIIHFVAKTLYGMLHWGLNAQAAVNLPNFAGFEDATLLEAGRFGAATVASLKARGHAVLQPPLPSGLQAITPNADGFFGAADPRREGIVLGD